MPVRPLTYNESIAVWRVMVDNMAAVLEEMPHLRELHAELSALVAHALALEEESLEHEAKLRETNHARRTTLAKGRALRNQLAALLRGSLGLESDRLVAFGVAPRRRHPRRRRSAAAAAKADGPPVN